MNKNVLLIIGGAFFMAFLVALIVSSRLSGGTDNSEQKTQILVANRKLTIGDRVKEKDVRWQTWPDSALFRGVFQREEDQKIADLDIFDAPLRRSVQSGEPITRHTLVIDAKDSNNFLAAIMKPGYRAVSIKVKDETAVGGFLMPGDFVDVIVAFTPRLDRDLKKHAQDIFQNYASQTVVRNVRVLAVDQEAKEEERQAQSAKTVTIEVTREGAEKVALAEAMGTLSFALRRIGDEDRPEDALTDGQITDSRFSKVIQEAARKKAVDEVKDSETAVRVYSGTTIMNIPVREE